MTEVTSLRPVAAVAVTAVAIVPILLSGRRPALREAWTGLAGLAKFAIVASLVPGVLAGTVYVTPAIPFLPGAPLAFRADALGVLFALVASGLYLVAALYSVGYMRGLGEANQTRFFAAFAASLAATLAVAFAANLVTLFVAYELLTVATYPLVVHSGTDEARRSGRKYVLYTLGGGVALLGGVLVVHAVAGTTAFGADTATALLGADPTLARAGFGLLVAGFGVKAALVPLHGWLPDAMVAPTPVSGLLHAVAVVKSGVFGVARVVLDIYGVDAVADLGVGLPLAAAAAVTMTVAGLLALRQRKLKRGLAYSTVSQLSYIVLGLAVLHPEAVEGGLLHLSAHALLKLTLFFCAGIIYVETGAEYLDELAGVGRRLPLTMTLFAVAAAGLAGFPLVAGFVSKWTLLVGLAGAGQALLAGVLLVSGLLKLLFFWPIVAAAFFPDDPAAPAADGAVADGGDHAPAGDAPAYERRAWYRETSWRLLAPIAAVMALAVLYGIAPDLLPVVELAQRVAEVHA